MRKVRFTTNVDRLKLKCSGGDWLLSELDRDGEIAFGGGWIVCKEKEAYKGDEAATRKIVADAYLDGYDSPMMELSIELSHYTHIKVYNRVFYSEGIYHYVLPMIDELGLKVEAVERVELCLDCNVSLLARIRKLIKDKNHDMIVNGAKVDDDEACLMLICDVSRDRIHTTDGTLYKKNASGFDLKVYNKIKEIANTGKNYIAAHNQMGGIMHRLEVGISGHYISSRHEDTMQFLSDILIPQERAKIIVSLCDRILRFNPRKASDKKKAQTVSLVDLIY